MTDELAETSPDGFYEYPNQQYVKDFELAEGSYRLEVRDSNSDGICCAYGHGEYSFYVDGVLARASDGVYGTVQMTAFTVPYTAPPPMPSPPNSPPAGTRSLVKVKVRPMPSRSHQLARSCCGHRACPRGDAADTHRQVPRRE